jgi:predicted RNA-binding protein with RPS1 domain
MVKAKVLDVDVEKERISLGIKQLIRAPAPASVIFSVRLPAMKRGAGADQDEAEKKE